MASFSRSLYAIGVLTGLLAMAVLLGSGCSSSDSLPPAHADNPLRECPDSPNCERVSARYPVPPERLYAGATTALDALGPIRLQAQSDSIQASAVYRVALVFKDDVDVAVDSISDGSRLHVRSASRLGHSDLGVNRRRVQHLLSRVDDALDATSN